MKKILLRYSILIISLTGFISCEGFLSFNPPIESLDDGDIIADDGDDNNDDGDDGNDDGVPIEVSIDDPQQTGSCDSPGRSFMVDVLDIIDIPDSLPASFDLSSLMPPVRSQGNQGSCVAWATTYYLKSYQEKVQHGYEYSSFDYVMSPAYIYNQTALGSCDSGSAVSFALETLQTQGVVPWSSFPYDDEVCSTQPNEEQFERANRNQIGDFFIVGVPDSIPSPNYTKINVMKTLLRDKNPLVMSFSIKEVDFSYQDTLNNEYLGLTYTPDPDVTCGHAVLIVGYDDNVGAFKFVNSWGTFWGNDGYGWLSYDFFLPSSDPDHQESVGGIFIAYDKIEDNSNNPKSVN